MRFLCTLLLNWNPICIGHLEPTASMETCPLIYCWLWQTNFLPKGTDGSRCYSSETLPASNPIYKNVWCQPAIHRHPPATQIGSIEYSTQMTLDVISIPFCLSSSGITISISRRVSDANKFILKNSLKFTYTQQRLSAIIPNDILIDVY